MKLRHVLSAFALLCAFKGHTAQIPMTSASRATGAIKIDGVIDEPAWIQAVEVGDFRALKSDAPPARGTRFAFIYDAEALYFSLRSHIPAGAAKAIPECRGKALDGPVYSDECLELYLQPGPAAPYYHFVVNIDGVRYDGKGMDGGWNADWSAAAGRTDDVWTAEVRIPFFSLGIGSVPCDGTEWRMNVARNDRINGQYQTWAHLVRGFHEPESFGILAFVDAAVGIDAGKPSRNGEDIVWEMQGSGANKETVKADVSIRTSAGQFDLSGSLPSNADERTKLQLKAAGAWLPDGSVWSRMILWLGKRKLYAPLPLVVPGAELPNARPDQTDPVTISNAEVALTFDRGSGRLLSAENLAAGMKVAFGGTGTPIIELDTVSFRRNPRYFQKEDIITVVPDFETLVRVAEAATGNGESITIKHRIKGGIDIALTITVPPTGCETQWDIDLHNRRTLRPSQSLVVHRVRYPMIPALSEDACGDDPVAVVPYMMGQKIADPATNLKRSRPYPYIGPLTMGWFDYSGKNGGLYFKTGDVDPLPQTDMLLGGDPDEGSVALGIQRWALCWPGQRWQPGPCGIAPHAGDWHAAADFYRTWFRKTFTLRPTPTWLREADGYVMSGGPSYEFEQLPRALDNALAIGINYIELWSEMTGGDISYHAYGFPNPYMGTEKDLRKAVKKLHAAGGHLGVYLNFNTGDPLLGTFLRQPAQAQKIPEREPRPALDYMKDNWLQQSIMNHDGSYSMWPTSVPGYIDDYWNQCPAAEKWTDLYYHGVVDKWAKDYGIDAWYLDSCPVSRGSPCFAFDHGHRDPMPEGQAIINFYKRLRKGAPKDFCILQEYSSDRLLQWGTHALGLMWHPPHAHPEVVRYTLPEMVLFSGMCNGIAGLKQFYPDEQYGPKDALERVFLIGNRYELPMTYRPPEFANEWQRKMVALRHACGPEMNYGDFLDDIGLGPVPDRVYARLFRAADRRRLIVTLLDRRTGEKEPFKLDLDLTALGVSACQSASLRDLEESYDVDVSSVPGGSSVTVPAYQGRVAALFLETSGPAGPAEEEE